MYPVAIFKLNLRDLKTLKLLVLMMDYETNSNTRRGMNSAGTEGSADQGNPLPPNPFDNTERKLVYLLTIIRWKQLARVVYNEPSPVGLVGA